MNEQNYGSLEACQRLVKAGIVLETDCCFAQDRLHDGVFLWEIHPRITSHKFLGAIPAPSMAEVWRELPPNTMIRKFGSDTWVWITDKEDSTRHNINPTDALIYLRIWLEERKEKS